MKNIKFLIATIVAVALLGGFAYSKLPDKTQKLVNFHQHLVKERQGEWNVLNVEREEAQEALSEIIAKMEQVEAEANMFRETIAVLTDFPQPENQQ